MADQVRNLDALKADQAISVLNKHRLDMLKLRAGTLYHADASPAISAADATDLATAITLANAIKASLNTHEASACDATTGQGVHMAADATNTVTAANATDLTTLITLTTQERGKSISHVGATTPHPVADATNVPSVTVATDAATAVTLVNDIKTKLNGHFAAAMNHQATNLVAP